TFPREAGQCAREIRQPSRSVVAGATGTGKTVSLLVLAEGFLRMGVPVFMADVEGDVAGLAMAGVMNEKIRQRADQVGIKGYANEANPRDYPL
ncbi:MAG: DUF853 family protein, partial [Chitinispirillaceae bacterium]|nr:DUF853 family protein [Chitinispirillaceae bacterium]